MARFARAQGILFSLYKQASAPTTAESLTVGDMWIDTSGTATLKVCTSVSPVTFATAGGSESPLTTKGDIYVYDTADSRLAIGSDDNILLADSNASTGLSWKAHRPYLRYRGSSYDYDFITGSIAEYQTQNAAANGGSVSWDTTTFTDGTACGVQKLDTSTATNGNARTYPQTISSATYLNNGEYFFEARLRMPNLSDATDTFQIAAGLVDANNVISPSNGILLRYTHGTHSGNWELYTALSASSTSTDSSSAVAANTWYRVGFIVNATCTSVTFYVNGTSVGTVSTNLPTAVKLFPAVLIFKTAGTTSRVLFCDYIATQKDFSSSR